MENSEFMQSIIALGGVPFILGLVQLFKPFITDTRLYPLVAALCGVAINLIAGWALGASQPMDWVTALFNGFIAGMAASGLYSASSTLKEGAAADKANPLHQGESHEIE